ncbi:hypothetical protein MIND_01374200 [Mycena indigotica]|uniref:BTB domain-containing protein n=1 Tax=Mycena indigotica TaxID=2126181 RepID=A0A8H6RYC2_9AGAR|nr:uncharacterized protein MIND_01374200 [Mycena indigotica]KAF7289132.1 hypothetical protein MIND_01374200 [Mycena indigotica]
MALVKKCPDTWTENGVQSTFDITFSSTSSLTGTTDVCGWGWRFAWDCSDGPVTVYFDPHLIANAKYGRVSCALSTTGLRTEIYDIGTFSVTLPLLPTELPPSTAGWPIGRCSRTHVKALRRKFDSESSRSRPSETPPAVLTVTISFEAAHGFAPPQPLTIRTRLPFSEEPLPARIRACLADTIHGGELIDVKFWLYSRVATGYVYHPRPLYGNLKLMRGTSKQFDQDIDDLLSGFAESGQTDIATDKPPQAAFEEYDYMSDSDMDEDEAIDGDMIVDEEGPETPEAQSAAGPSTQIIQAVNDSETIIGRRGYRIVIKGHAYNTWKALLSYLYTGDIHFCKIKAGKGHSPPAKRDDGAPECSPKSMYKLAEKHGLEDLKARALESIRSQMSADTIVHEAFSNFTAMFEEVKAMQVGFLRKNLRDAAVREGLTGMLLHLCDGRGSSASAAVLQDVIYGPNGGLSLEYA